MEDNQINKVNNLIAMHYSSMSKPRQKIADYIRANPSGVIQESINVIAEKAGVKSTSSVVRFYRMLGFESFSDFKIKLAQDLAGNTFFHSSEDLNMNDPLPEIKRKFISGSIAALTALMEQQDDDIFDRAVDLIMNSGRLIFLGYAASAAICYYAYFRFLELGINCCFSVDSHISAAILANPRPDDLVFCVSVSGETTDIIRQLTPRSHEKGNIIVLTANPSSTLGTIADVAISTNTIESSVVTDAMNARLLQFCVVDILYSVLCTRIGDEALRRLSETRQTFKNYKHISQQNFE